MANEQETPILQALPPETDYITYLTIVEYNLTEKQLPIFHDILQDTTLTANIAWDLVHILLPLLPASEQCLHDVAELGNPREVILKVTEILEGLSHDPEHQDTGSEIEPDDSLLEPRSIQEHKPNLERPYPEVIPNSVLKFQVLMRMLSILHSRIRTKYPSRFLLTSIEAILPAYEHLHYARPATEAVFGFIEALAQARRPSLPPRSKNAVKPADLEIQALDPEASPELVSQAEVDLQVSLLRSFITHVTRIYIEALPAVGDSTALAWSDRLYEISYPERIVPFRKSVTSTFRESRDYQDRDMLLHRILNRLQGSLAIEWDELIWVATHSERDFLAFGSSGNLNVFTKQLPPSRRGIIYLLTARMVSKMLYNTTEEEKLISPALHYKLVRSYVGDDALQGIGSEPQPLIDAIIALGAMALQGNQTYVPPSEEEGYHQYLQRLSLLSANTPSSSLRYQAHLLTSAVLHAHPWASVRLNFIRDTLEHCPYESLKVSAVGWLKDEILKANVPPRLQKGEVKDARAGQGRQLEETSLFSRPATLATVWLHMFPTLSTSDDVSTFPVRIHFYHATMNLCYLLCTSPLLSERLEIVSMSKDSSIRTNHLKPLLFLAQKLKNEVLSTGREAGDIAGDVADIELLENTLGRVLSVAP